MSFYRKYRPQTIDQLDNEAVKVRLTALAQKKPGELPHAYLLSGPRGTGKTTSARIIAKLFNCQKPKSGTPCGVCDQCKTITAGTNLDVIEIDAASNRGIDEIRLLRERIGLSPTGGAFTVYIIDEVHMLTTEAFNALLKTLEEPPAHAVFILATTELQKVPLTIVSRCVEIPFFRASHDELSHGLSAVMESEKITLDSSSMSLIIAQADGSFRDAVKLLEGVSFLPQPATVEAVRALLSASSSEAVERFVKALANSDTREALAIISVLSLEGVDFKTFMTDVVRYLGMLMKGLVEGKACIFTKAQLASLLHGLTAAFGELKLSPVPSLPLELVVVDYCENASVPVAIQKEEPSPPQRILAPEISRIPPILPSDSANESPGPSLGLISLEKLTECWKDVIEELKPLNHSIAGVLRSTRPSAVQDGIVTIVAFYKFHQEKLSEPKIKEILVGVFKKLFGEKVKVEIVLGKK